MKSKKYNFLSILGGLVFIVILISVGMGIKNGSSFNTKLVFGEGEIPVNSDILTSTSEDHNISLFLDATIPYNTVTELKPYDNGIYHINSQESVKINISFTNSSEYKHHIEIGFINTNDNKIDVIYDDACSELSLNYTFEKDVKGEFYIWNKAIDDIMIEELRISIGE